MNKPAKASILRQIKANPCALFLERVYNCGIPPGFAEVQRTVVAYSVLLQREGYHGIEPLGSGANAVVLKCKKNDTAFAAKCPLWHWDHKITKRLRENLVEEQRIAALVSEKTPATVRTEPILIAGCSCVFLTELFGANLVDFLGELLKASAPGNCKVLSAVVQKMHSCVQEVNKAGVRHNDVKLNNFLIDEHMEVKIIDFGRSASTAKVVKDYWEMKALGQLKQFKIKYQPCVVAVQGVACLVDPEAPDFLIHYLEQDKVAIAFSLIYAQESRFPSAVQRMGPDKLAQLCHVYGARLQPYLKSFLKKTDAEQVEHECALAQLGFKGPCLADSLCTKVRNPQWFHRLDLLGQLDERATQLVRLLLTIQ